MSVASLCGRAACAAAGIVLVLGAPAASAAETDWGAEIAAAFRDLGMEDARAECYGEVLTSELSPENQKMAARLVRESGSAEDVKVNVISAGPKIVGGFSAADASCPEGMGG